MRVTDNNNVRAKRLNKENKLRAGIAGLVRELDQLAPHPASSFSGPHFIQHHPLFNKAASYEGILGSLMVESFLGEAFFDAANENSSSTALSFGWNDAMDLTSEYLEETDPKGRGQGSMARLPEWNAGAAPASPAFNAWAADLPRRRKTEAALADKVREYDALAPAFAA